MCAALITPGNTHDESGVNHIFLFGSGYPVQEETTTRPQESSWGRVGCKIGGKT